MPRKPHAASALLLAAAALPLSSCDALQQVLEEGVQAPTSGLSRVDLTQSPSLNQLLSYSCHTYLSGSSSACALAGWNNPPAKSAMQFSFDIVFDLYNPNSAIPIPLVELLMGFSVFEDQNLGAVCVSFCDPEAEDCDSAGQNVEGACEMDDETTEVDEASDLVPTVDDLLDLASDVASGDADNWAFRVIPTKSAADCQPASATCTEETEGDETLLCCDGECAPLAHDECAVIEKGNGQTCAECDGHVEAHIAFDFNIDTMLGLFERLLVNAVEDAIAGRNVNLDIPYTTNGTLFFDVPNMGRYAVGYGPFGDTWEIRAR